MHVKTFRRFPMLRYLPRQEWEKRKFSFYRKEQPKYSWLKRWGKEDQRVPSGTNPSFRLLPWGVEGEPHLKAVQLVISEMQCSFPERSDYVTNIFTAAPLRNGAELQLKASPVTNSVPVHPSTSVLSRSTTTRAKYRICNVNMVAMLRIFTWWDNRRKEL